MWATATVKVIPATDQRDNDFAVILLGERVREGGFTRFKTGKLEHVESVRKAMGDTRSDTL